MNALQELIRTRMTQLNRSYGEIARRGGLPRSTVYHLAANNRPVRVPNPQTLERLALGLEVPEQVVRAAAAAAAGLVLDKQPADDPEITVLVASLARLSAEDRRHVSALVRSMLEATDREQRPRAELPEGNELISPSFAARPSDTRACVLGWQCPSFTAEVKENDMRIIWSPRLPAVVLVRGRGVLGVAVPEGLPPGRVLELASLVLSTSEFDEFRRAAYPLADCVIRVDASVSRWQRP